MVTQTEVEIRVHIGEVTLLVTVGLGYDKGDIHVATLPHALSETVAGGAETAEDVRWKFPPEH